MYFLPVVVSLYWILLMKRAWVETGWFDPSIYIITSRNASLHWNSCSFSWGVLNGVNPYIPLLSPVHSVEVFWTMLTFIHLCYLLVPNRPPGEHRAANYVIYCTFMNFIIRKSERKKTPRMSDRLENKKDLKKTPFPDFKSRWLNS